MDDEIPRCGSLQHVSYSNFVLSILIALGIVVSYLPQHYRIIHKKSVEGISPYFLLLGLISSTCALWNILLLQRSVVGCCASLTLLQCFAAVLGILQIVLQFAMFAVVFILYLIYLPRLHTSAVYMTAIYLAFFVASASLTIFFGRSRQLYQVRFAYVLGLVGAGLAILQYFPQLYTTWAFSHVGSLSIPMMCLQTPGSILFAFTLAMRKGTNWSTWGVYAVTAVLQGTLLAMCITFEYRDRQKGKAATGAACVWYDDDGSSEATREASYHHHRPASCHSNCVGVLSCGDGTGYAYVSNRLPPVSNYGAGCPVQTTR